MKVAKWGNSLAVRLPATAIEELGLKEGDEIELLPTGQRSFEIAKGANVPERIARLRELLKGRLPEGYKFDRDEANER
jgi:antitoxin MazE